jgi:hypothetical protein
MIRIKRTGQNNLNINNFLINYFGLYFDLVTASTAPFFAAFHPPSNYSDDLIFGDGSDRLPSPGQQEAM